MSIAEFEAASPERLVHLAACARPTPSQGESTAARQIHDALYFAGQHDRVAVCVDEDGALVGAVSWTPSVAGETAVRNLGSRLPGIGTLLLRHVAADADRRGEGIVLESVPSAAGFYDKLGFVRCGTSELGYPLFALDPTTTSALAR